MEPAVHLVEAAGSGTVNEYTPTTAHVTQVGGARVLQLVGLKPLHARAYICGPAATCACAPADNLGLHAALARAAVGSVLVCDGGSDLSTALFGELMGTDALNRGVLGLVVTGAVRDVSELESMGFPVFGLGTAPAQSSKSRLISVGMPVSLSGVPVSPGDPIVADRDAVVVVAQANWPAVRAEARQRAAAEEEVLERLRAGERLADVRSIDLDPQRT
ncbi:MAG: RraA family protein [Candidatus Dormibacteria bacterium]